MRYLQRYRDAEKLRCPSCGGADGKWLAGREQWQCRQLPTAGERTERDGPGTVPVVASGLVRAIAAILQDRQISTEALCDITGIRRAKTVRALAQRIRQAIDSPEAERLLAGLDWPTLTRLAGTGC